MSFQTFLASDVPMLEVENPHVKFLSVNEAIQIGIKLPDMIAETIRYVPDADKETVSDQITVHGAVFTAAESYSDRAEHRSLHLGGAGRNVCKKNGNCGEEYNQHFFHFCVLIGF